MITHLVMFNPTDDASTEQVEGVLDLVRTSLSQIPGVRRVAAGSSFAVVQEPPYRFGFLLEFANRQDLDAYIAHPVHQQFRQVFFPIRAGSLVMDFEMT